MKRTALYFVLLISISEFQAQCSFSGLNPMYCLNAPQVTLTSSPPGSTFSGPGMNGSVFVPSSAGIGTHTIQVFCSDYTVSNGTFAPDLSPGTPVFLGDDDTSAALPIGFSFRFFCINYTSFQISSNGFITFSHSQPDGCCSGDFLPNFVMPYNLVAFAWADLDPTAGGAITYTTVGVSPNRKLCVNFVNIHHYSDPNTVSMQLQLQETTNLIEIHTYSMTTDGNLHTMGIENIGGTAAFVVPGRNSDPSWSAYNEMKRFSPSANCAYSQTTVVTAPTVGISGNTIICSGGSGTLAASGAVTYSWSNSLQTQSISISPSASTVYAVTGIDANGCTGNATVAVTVSTLLPVSITGHQNAICQGAALTLTASGTSTYSWSTGAQGNTVIVTPSTTTTYSVSGATGNCQNTTAVTVTVNPEPALTSSVSSPTICAGKSVSLSAGGASGYTWTSASGNLTLATIVVTAANGINTFTLAGMGTNGCMKTVPVSFTATLCDGVTVTSKSEPDFLVFPNPNGGSFTISMENGFSGKLFNETGILVKEFRTTGQKITVDHLPPGIYLLLATSGGSNYKKLVLVQD